LVEIAVGSVVHENSDIFPWVRSPIRIVVSLFRALITVSVTIVVLSGEDGRLSVLVEVSCGFTIGNPETHVSLSGLAILVVIIVLVHSVSEIIVSVGVSCGRSVRRVGDRVGG